MAPPAQHIAGKVATEFVGTMFLCLTVALTKGMVLAPLAIGFVLMVLVYTGGHASGAHYNPAVTLAVLLRGGGCIQVLEAAFYVMAQLVGAIAGALLGWALIGRDQCAYPAIHGSVGTGAAFLGEVLITFSLCTVVLLTATSKSQANNSYYGLAIGSTVLSGAVTVGPFTGGAFNPAVGIMGLIYEHNDDREDVWLYWVAPLLAAALAAGFFRVVAPEEYTEQTITKNRELLASCLMEMAGTGLLCFTVGVAATLNHLLTPLAIGSILMVYIYAGGSVSGAHYNPAVTLGVLVRTFLGATHDNFHHLQAVVYWGAQIIGALGGTFCAWCLWETTIHVGYPTLPVGKETWKGCLGEFIGTFLLVLTVLNVATVKQLAGNSFFGLAIGQSVTCLAIAIGPVSGGAFNPAVGLVGPFSWGQNADLKAGEVWLYWVFCPLGAVAAAGFFRLMNFEEFHKRPAKEKFMAHVHEDAHGSRFQKHACKQTQEEVVPPPPPVLAEI